MENTALLKAIIDNAIDGIITIDDHGKIESINPSGCKLFAYEAHEVIGMNISMMMPKPDKEQHDGYLQNYRRTGQPNIIGKGREVSGLRKDGSIFPFRLAISEVQFSGRKIYTGFIHDLSKEKEAEEKLKDYAAHLEEQVELRTQLLNESVKALEAANSKVNQSLDKEKELGQLKSRFVSMASHEFRTPLSSIQLSSDLIEKYAENSDIENINRHLGKIKNSVTNLTGILNDFLSLERLETGKMEPEALSFDIVGFSAEITEEMQVIAKEDQKIIYGHTGISSIVRIDQSLLKTCIINLISNAIKYSGEHTFIQFSTVVTDKNIIVSIKDNGIGIPKEDQKHLFEPFFRAHNTGNIPGTGLGLNIVSRYTELMNGTVSFSSDVTQSTSFTLSFPNQHE
ncbi:PAS domain-containing sensor histidine kinase [Mucilaginibacter sp. FT3.2]|uniref:PAS domain-containing sensor histidine kinase n=1 Tax=Mucilaginibacter sp. FT3.2 TaxID=2723090 RepID=UPI0016206ECF|nr:PAS domain-containing sensor histidine kinase [Mucilaginibacter sp. FT3.2]MBB6233692.1 PAS domain S-box-containing protein [Mucilaginibacter sp. FT3.2]